MYNVLIVDDDKTVRYMLKRFKKWELYGFAIAGEACDGKEALNKLAAGRFDLVITDIKMPGMDGIEFLQELKIRKMNICVMLLSTYCDFEYAKQGIRLGAFDYMGKPVEEAVLSEALERAKKHLTEKKLQFRQKAEEKKLVEESLMLYYPKSQEKRLTDLLLSASSETVAAAANIFAELTVMLQQDLLKTNMLLEKILMDLNDKIYSAFPWLEKIAGMTFTGWRSPAESLDEVRANFLHYIGNMLEIVKKYELHHTDSVVRKTCQYVMNHIEEDIKLEQVANEVHISRDYIGKLFKQKTGSNFLDYVTRVKMEHAKYLLKTGEYKNYEVSEKIGYSSPDYFCRLFKSYTGYTPIEFRKLGS